VRHVAFLIPTIDRIGGAEQQVISLAKGLMLRNWKVSVIALSGTGGDAAHRLGSMGIDFLSLSMRKGLADPRGWIRLHLWVKRNQPDLVHAHLPHAFLLARWSRIYSPVRVLVNTIHSPATGGLARQIGFRMSAALPDVVTAVSHSAAKPWLASGMVRDEKLAVIPNGVDLDHWKRDDNVRSAMRRELQVSNEFLWLSVGRLDPVKDHATLLRAFSLLPDLARLIIAGTGPLQIKLTALANELGLGGRVRFLGFDPDILPWLCAADGFVLCSRWEGLPIALLEACACEMPSVVTEIAGVHEVMPDSFRPAPVPVGESHSLAAAMRTIMRMSPSERRKLGESLRKSIAAKFNLETVLDQWEALYSEALNANLQPLRFGRAGSPFGSTLQLQ